MFKLIDFAAGKKYRVHPRQAGHTSQHDLSEGLEERSGLMSCVRRFPVMLSRSDCLRRRHNVNRLPVDCVASRETGVYVSCPGTSAISCGHTQPHLATYWDPIRYCQRLEQIPMPQIQCGCGANCWCWATSTIQIPIEAAINTWVKTLYKATEDMALYNLQCHAAQGTRNLHIGYGKKYSICLTTTTLATRKRHTGSPLSQCSTD